MRRANDNLSRRSLTMKHSMSSFIKPLLGALGLPLAAGPVGLHHFIEQARGILARASHLGARINSGAVNKPCTDGIDMGDAA